MSDKGISEFAIARPRMQRSRDISWYPRTRPRVAGVEKFLARWRRPFAPAFRSGTIEFRGKPNPASRARTTYRSPAELKKLSLEDLVDTQSPPPRADEFLSHASSAIDVVTSDDIRRSGVTNLPDALRLATGMQVAQVDGHTWAISTRGFNISTANKVHVVMDGRSLYTPLFSGVFWDVQHTFLPDVEQIEVIRGPGATLWGANAVNGVINIRTKSAEETQGTLIYGGAGNEETGMGGVRYGGKIGRHTFYRVYVMHQSRDSRS